MLPASLASSDVRSDGHHQKGNRPWSKKTPMKPPELGDGMGHFIGLIESKGPADIKRLQEQKEILEGILRERGL